MLKNEDVDNSQGACFAAARIRASGVLSTYWMYQPALCINPTEPKHPTIGFKEHSAISHHLVHIEEEPHSSTAKLAFWSLVNRALICSAQVLDKVAEGDLAWNSFGENPVQDQAFESSLKLFAKQFEQFEVEKQVHHRTHIVEFMCVWWRFEMKSPGALGWVWNF